MICAVIVAGGSGSRMKSLQKKQYMVLDTRPTMAHTLLAFDSYSPLGRIVLVVPKEDIAFCHEDIILPLTLDHDILVIPGGKRRQDSVAKGLDALETDAGIVMIHDGVRPFVRHSIMDACIKGVRETGACIPAIGATDTLKRVDENGIIVKTLKRHQILLAQTPQTFSISLIRKAHQLAKREGFTATDDASIAEFAGEKVVVVSGDPDQVLPDLHRGSRCHGAMVVRP